jgi:hypothetical protein
MQHFLNVVESMGKLSNTYNIQGGRLKVTLPKQLEDVRGELTKRFGHLMQQTDVNPGTCRSFLRAPPAFFTLAARVSDY